MHSGDETDRGSGPPAGAGVWPSGSFVTGGGGSAEDGTLIFFSI